MGIIVYQSQRAVLRSKSTVFCTVPGTNERQVLTSIIISLTGRAPTWAHNTLCLWCSACNGLPTALQSHPAFSHLRASHWLFWAWDDLGLTSSFSSFHCCLRYQLGKTGPYLPKAAPKSFIRTKTCGLPLAPVFMLLQHRAGVTGQTLEPANQGLNLALPFPTWVTSPLSACFPIYKME